VLQGIISQRLIPAVEGTRRAAMEVLVKTPMIEKLIIENRDYEISDAIESGREHYKSQSFDQSIFDLYTAGVISQEDALNNATSAPDLKLKMSGLSTGKAPSSDKNTNVEVDINEDVFGLKE